MSCVDPLCKLEKAQLIEDLRLLNQKNTQLHRMNSDLRNLLLIQEREEEVKEENKIVKRIRENMHKYHRCNHRTRKDSHDRAMEEGLLLPNYPVSEICMESFDWRNKKY